VLTTSPKISSGAAGLEAFNGSFEGSCSIR
jgi:hypothetical protein